MCKLARMARTMPVIRWNYKLSRKFGLYPLVQNVTPLDNRIIAHPMRRSESIPPLVRRRHQLLHLTNMQCTPAKRLLMTSRSHCADIGPATYPLEKAVFQLLAMEKEMGFCDIVAFKNALRQYKAASVVSLRHTNILLKSSGARLTDQLPEQRHHLMTEVWQGGLDKCEEELSLLVFNQRLDTFNHNKHKYDPKEELEMLKEQFGLTPDFNTYSKIISLYSEELDMDGINTIMEEMQDEGIPLDQDPSIYCSLARCFALNDDQSGVEQVLEVIKQQDMYTPSSSYFVFDGIMRAYVSRGNMAAIEALEKYIKAMEMRNVALIDLYTSALGELAVMGSKDLVPAMLQLIKAEQEENILDERRRISLLRKPLVQLTLYKEESTAIDLIKAVGDSNIDLLILIVRIMLTQERSHSDVKKVLKLYGTRPSNKKVSGAVIMIARHLKKEVNTGYYLWRNTPFFG